MSHRVPVDLGERSYDVVIENDYDALTRATCAAGAGSRS